ncbi:hypothetical protein BRD17_06415 [Halobacteriales archaeon SW_7_68_16]|nr:MAG: hypothetical protein BRD17_06415 [Halobacteriales archaeon SW_7_68_16]
MSILVFLAFFCLFVFFVGLSDSAWPFNNLSLAHCLFFGVVSGVVRDRVNVVLNEFLNGDACNDAVVIVNEFHALQRAEVAVEGFE